MPLSSARARIQGGGESDETRVAVVGRGRCVALARAGRFRSCGECEEKPIKPRTLVAERTSIDAFAQDGNRIGWVSADGRVQVRRLAPAKSWVLGRVHSSLVPSATAIALAGLRALWMWDAGGNSTDYPIVSGAPGQKSVEIVRLYGGLRGYGDGLDPTGLAGDGATLAFGWVAEVCPRSPDGLCEADQPLVVGGGGISLAGAPVTAVPRRPAVIAGVPPPALFAVSDGEVAVVAARSPTPLGYAPRVTEDGSVDVYDLSGKLLLPVGMVGIVRDIALSGKRLAVLMERPDGKMWLEQFTIPNPSRSANATAVPRTAVDLSISSAGVVYRVGTQIFVARAGGGPTRVWKASATPMGLSIEGRRIAWAENIKGAAASSP